MRVLFRTKTRLEIVSARTIDATERAVGSEIAFTEAVQVLVTDEV